MSLLESHFYTFLPPALAQNIFLFFACLGQYLKNLPRGHFATIEDENGQISTSGLEESLEELSTSI